MSTITQRIPTLLLGISQQPDTLKFPGQVVDANNVFPDYALGMLKRPGGKFVANLPGATTTGKWFSILRDNEEKYVAQYDDNTFRIWSLVDSALGKAGSPRVVDMGDDAGVPNTCKTISITNAGSGLTDGTFTNLATTTTGNGTGLTLNLTIASGVVSSVTINQYGTNYPDGATITMSDTDTYPSVEFSYAYPLKTRTTTYNTEVKDTADELEDLNEFGAAFAQANLGQISVETSHLNVVTTYDDIYNQTVKTGIVYDDIRYTITQEIDGGNDILINDYTSAPFTFAGTYTRSGDTITVTSTDHGFSTGHYIKLVFTSGEGSSATYRITVTSDDTFTVTDSITGTTSGNVTIYDRFQLGTERTTDYPILKQKGLQVYELVTQAAATHTAAELTTATNNLTSATTDYNTAVTDEATAKTAYDSEVANCVISSLPTNAYLKDATADDIELLTLNDYTFVLNKAMPAKMLPDLTAALPYQAFIVVGVVAYNADYTIILNGTEYTIGTPQTTTAGSIDAAAIAQDIADELNTISGITAVPVGPGVYVSSNVEFTILAEGGNVEDAIYVFQDKINVSGRLPNECRDGYIVKVYNSDQVDADDMWVKFETTEFDDDKTGLYGYSAANNWVLVTMVDHGFTDGAVLPLSFIDGDAVGYDNIYTISVIDDDSFSIVIPNFSTFTQIGSVTTQLSLYGAGVWEETVSPELKYKIDPLTMPHQLVRQSDGSFTFDPIDWENRLVGDNLTNPIPSFIEQEQTINNVFFYRNRLGFVSNETVFLGKAGDYFNLFAGSAQLVAADDPIDLNVTSQQPVNLNFVQPVSVGLILFGQNEQFLLSTDADILGPTTAKLNTLSKYECDSKVAPVSLGTTVSFISKTLLWTRAYELNNIQKESPANTIEITNNVSELIPSDINDVIASPALSLLSYGQRGTSTLYQYRYFQNGDQRVVNTWYKWELAGNLREQFFDQTTFYAVCDDGTNVFIQSYDLTQSSEQGFLTLPTGEKTDVCLDMFTVNPRRTYNAANDTTRIFLPYDHITGKIMRAVLVGGFIGSPVTNTQSIGLIPDDINVVTNDGDVDYFDVEGDYRGRNLVIGYLYDMTIELPKLYSGQVSGNNFIADSSADLILHRIKVNTGLSGPVTYNIDITGKDGWDNVVNVTLPNTYNLNSVNLSATAQHVVPIFQRNTNCKITIKGNTAFPVSITSLAWEGNYNTRFYRRS
jgi:hypothetical protein